jgi:putative glutamine amidotransferase
LLLPGGEDVDPAFYGEARHEKCGRVSLDRDETELALARWAMEEGKPLFAICRGIQVLNVAQGGSLYQDIQTQVPGTDKHDWYPDHPRDRQSHTLEIVPRTRLAQLSGTTSLPVNSLHHQAIKEAAPGLVVVAHAEDGIVEAVEAPDHPFALGVQWHPEELASRDARAQRLFDAFVEACRR